MIRPWYGCCSAAGTFTANADGGSTVEAQAPVDVAVAASADFIAAAWLATLRVTTVEKRRAAVVTVLEEKRLREEEIIVAQVEKPGVTVCVANVAHNTCQRATWRSQGVALVALPFVTGATRAHTAANSVRKRCHVVNKRVCSLHSVAWHY
eukprot:TRINITY_DN1609_c0_g1_i2.p1 TRINITY_DN1609_c0_g1~~TRINITY_DN1609_c0_g1_i2.p1  ORF type:complete len:151 (-),score=41.65 TRINITY_DN1609_c0_g1_i2:36-488(-)